MIETEESVEIRAPIETVRDFARDIHRWADLMPGMQDCDLIDDDNSRWTLKVGVVCQPAGLAAASVRCWLIDKERYGE